MRGCLYLEGNRDELCFCSFSCINTGNDDRNTEIPLKGVSLLTLQPDAGECPPQSCTGLLPVKLDTNFYHLIGILLLKKITAPLPTRAFLVLLHLLVSLHFHVWVDLSRNRTDLRAWGRVFLKLPFDASKSGWVAVSTAATEPRSSIFTCLQQAEGPSCHRRAALVHRTPPRHAFSPMSICVRSLHGCPAFAANKDQAQILLLLSRVGTDLVTHGNDVTYPESMT